MSNRDVATEDRLRTIPVMRLLGLHGKGTNAFILRTQLAALARQSDLAESIDYINGAVECAPYHNIENWFPGQPYYAWYDAPTAKKLENAHDQLLSLIQGSKEGGQMEDLSSPGSAHPSRSTDSTPVSTWTRHSTRQASTAATSAVSSFEKSDPRSMLMERVQQRVPRYIRSPTVSEIASECFRIYQGAICFSQGCAVVAGLLLDQAKEEQRTGKEDQQPLKFAIFICEC